MRYLPLLKETIISGSIAALVMMPAGYLFQQIGLRVGHYGPKFAALFFNEPTQMVLVFQHFVLGWISALPLLFILLRLRRYSKPLAIGAAYGAAYYVAVNSLALPLYFGEVTPWQLGFTYIYPSLIIHIIFGMSIAYTSRKYIAREASPA